MVCVCVCVCDGVMVCRGGSVSELQAGGAQQESGGHHSARQTEADGKRLSSREDTGRGPTGVRGWGGGGGGEGVRG